LRLDLFRGGGGESPLLFLLGVEYDGDLLTADAYYADAPISAGERFTDGTTTMTVPQNLSAGLFSVMTEDLPERLESALVFIRGNHV